MAGRPRVAGEEMMDKYGAPQEVTAERMIWRNAGPFKRIMLTKAQLPHDFPLPHMDYLEHTISYDVPPDKSDEVHAFDASMTIYRVGGELSARCDLESNNVLTFNLAHDVITGKKTVDAARKEFGDIVIDRTLGKHPPYAMSLQFAPQNDQAAHAPEKTTIPGSPQRSKAGSADPRQPRSDGEIMALVVALDQNEVRASMAAERAFGRAWVSQMVAGHKEALQMLDGYMKSAQNAQLKQHLSVARQHVAEHSREAEQMQSAASAAGN